MALTSDFHGVGGVTRGRLAAGTSTDGCHGAGGGGVDGWGGTGQPASVALTMVGGARGMVVVVVEVVVVDVVVVVVLVVVVAAARAIVSATVSDVVAANPDTVLAAAR